MTAEWFEEFGAAIDRGEPFYRQCERCGASWLPPRTTCPGCGERAMTDAPLSANARVMSYTDIHVTTPRFHGETPYTVVLADFEEGVRLTGQLRGADRVEMDEEVALGAERLNGEDWLITFVPT